MVVKDRPSLEVHQTRVHRPAKIHHSLCDLRVDVDEPFSSPVKWVILRRSKLRDLRNAWLMVNAQEASSANSISPLRESFIHEQIPIGRLLSVQGCSSVGNNSDE